MSEQTRTQARGNGHATPEELEAEMAATREEMNETLAALGQRFTPEAMLNQAMERFGGPGEFANSLSSAVKSNPIPAALTGIGIGWLMMAQRQGWSSATPSSSAGMAEKMKHRGGGVAQAGREKMGQTGAKASESAREMRDRAEELSARSRAQLYRTSESARHWSGQVQSQGAQAGRRAGELFQEQPLIVGALAIGIGALAGAALQKRSEPEALTRQRESIRQRAEEAASEAMQQGREVAQAAGEAAAEKSEEVSSREGRGGQPPEAGGSSSRKTH